MPSAEDPHQSRVLIVEDEHHALDVLQRTLAGAGYHVLVATDGDLALEIALDERPDLVTLDLDLPGRTGFDLTRELRSRAFLAPILVLTARTAVSDRVEALDAGADDFLSTPIDPDELLARVRALIRRSSITSAQSLLRVGDLTVNPVSREVRRGHRPVVLTQKEYALLEYLMRHVGRAVSREQISEHVWKQPFDPATNIVDVYINYLRKKVDLDAGAALVQTVRGVGYMLRAG